MEVKRRVVKTILLVIAIFFCGAIRSESYSPYAKQEYPTSVYWGDTHLHTNMSLDANGMGNRALTPHDAYQFARGEVVTAHNGMKVRLYRPLDFLVVADHAENMGVMPNLESGNPALLNSETGKQWYNLLKKHSFNIKQVLTSSTDEKFNEMDDAVVNGPLSFIWSGFTSKDSKSSFSSDPVGYVGDESFRRSVWKKVCAIAEKYNVPNKFTALIGYEWSSNGTGRMGPGNLHRVVIFRDGEDIASRMLPFSAIDSENPEDLWSYLEHYQYKTGGEALAIPHNGNTSNGEMFASQNFRGNPLDRTYAETRSHWEPLYEITQIKGDGETHPILSPMDEFADYETWNSWSGTTYEGVKKKGWEKRKESEYARSALKLGLEKQLELGVNPFKFGFIGSTDAHTSLAAVRENNFWGKVTLLEPSRYRSVHIRPAQSGWQYGAAGYAAIWATENTREALFDAMKRKETYATTGPRMVVRFFGGWDYEKDDAFKPDLARIGYSKGVPMGGDLTAVPKGKAPSFLVRAVKDPDGANLDRVQLIKGWRSQDGELHEKIYNVALSDGRNEGPDGDAPPVGNTVNVAEASYTNSIGDPEFSVVWVDPDFDPDELAFYYVRVIEIPTPRWTAYDANFFGLEDVPEEVPMITQERAYTSPIWYSPR